MKVYIKYNPNKDAALLGGSRLRKVIKGCCEASNISWTETLDEEVEVAHFISPRDYKELAKLKKKGIKIVVSAFYCENDPFAAIFSHRKDGILSKKAYQMLLNADLVLVPGQHFVDLLSTEIPSCKARVMEPYVNLERFELNHVEKSIFPRYFRLRQNERYAVSVGDYSHKHALKLLKEIAKASPEIKFFFFGYIRRQDIGAAMRNYIRYRMPKNVILRPLAEDDVYRSALINAEMYLVLDQTRPDCFATVDAFAAKTSIIAYGQQSNNSLLSPGDKAFLVESVEEFKKAFSSIYEGKNKKFIISGRNYANNHSLVEGGIALKNLYENLLGKGE